MALAFYMALEKRKPGPADPGAFRSEIFGSGFLPATLPVIARDHEWTERRHDGKHVGAQERACPVSERNRRIANITATLGSFYWLGFETSGLSPDKKRLAWLGAQRLFACTRPM
jgi:hypothetical protein